MIEYIKSYLVQGPKHLAMFLKIIVILPVLLGRNIDLFESVVEIFIIYALQRALIIAPYQIIANELLYSRVHLIIIDKLYTSVILVILAVLLSFFHENSIFLVILTIVDVVFVYTVYLSFKLKEKSNRWFLSFAPNNYDYTIEIIGLVLLLATSSIYAFFGILILGRVILILLNEKNVRSFYRVRGHYSDFNSTNCGVNLHYKNVLDYTLSTFLPRATIDGVLLLAVIMNMSVESGFYMNRFYLNAASTITTAMLGPLLLTQSFLKDNKNVVRYFSLLLQLVVLLLLLGWITNSFLLFVLLSCGLSVGMNQSLFSYLKRLGLRENGYILYATLVVMLSLGGLYLGNLYNQTATIWLLALVLGNLIIFLRYWVGLR